jgi:hypothetical protein
VKAFTSAFAVAALGVVFVLPAGAQSNAIISGKLVDLVTYVTRDHHMGAMKGDHAMAGGDHAMAMAGDDHAMAGGDQAMAPASCPPLGVVSSKGKVILVSAEQGSATAKDLCSKINANVTLNGTSYSQGGTTVFVVTSEN